MTEKKTKEIKPVKQFTIVRRKWHRGKQTRERVSQLHCSDNDKMCCLGFYLEACGIPRGELTDRGFPYHILSTTSDDGHLTVRTPLLQIMRKAKARWLVKILKYRYTTAVEDSRDVTRLVDANDDQQLSGVEIEKKVKAIFKKHGVRVDFK